MGGAFWYGQKHGAGIADAQGSAYDSGAIAGSLLDYGISPSGENAYTGYGGSFVINPSLVTPSGSGSTTPTAGGQVAGLPAGFIASPTGHIVAAGGGTLAGSPSTLPPPPQ